MPTPKNSGFDPVEDAISEIAKGRMVIVTDDEDRENEGDVVMAASKVTPEAINHMIAHARGLICVPLLSNQLKNLGISSMVPHNREAQRTDFTVSVDAAEGITTGISAFDRSSTIQILANPSRKSRGTGTAWTCFPTACPQRWSTRAGWSYRGSGGSCFPCRFTSKRCNL